MRGGELTYDRRRSITWNGLSWSTTILQVWRGNTLHTDSILLCRELEGMGMEGEARESVEEEQCREEEKDRVVVKEDEEEKK